MEKVEEPKKEGGAVVNGIDLELEVRRRPLNYLAWDRLIVFYENEPEPDYVKMSSKAHKMASMFPFRKDVWLKAARYRMLEFTSKKQPIPEQAFKCVEQIYQESATALPYCTELWLARLDFWVQHAEVGKEDVKAEIRKLFETAQNYVGRERRMGAQLWTRRIEFEAQVGDFHQAGHAYRSVIALPLMGTEHILDRYTKLLKAEKLANTTSADYVKRLMQVLTEKSAEPATKKAPNWVLEAESSDAIQRGEEKAGGSAENFKEARLIDMMVAEATAMWGRAERIRQQEHRFESKLKHHHWKTDEPGPLGELDVWREYLSFNKKKLADVVGAEQEKARKRTREEMEEDPQEVITELQTTRADCIIIYERALMAFPKAPDLWCSYLRFHDQVPYHKEDGMRAYLYSRISQILPLCPVIGLTLARYQECTAPEDEVDKTYRAMLTVGAYPAVYANNADYLIRKGLFENAAQTLKEGLQNTCPGKTTLNNLDQQSSPMTLLSFRGEYCNLVLRYVRFKTDMCHRNMAGGSEESQRLLKTQLALEVRQTFAIALTQLHVYGDIYSRIPYTNSLKTDLKNRPVVAENDRYEQMGMFAKMVEGGLLPIHDFPRVKEVENCLQSCRSTILKGFVQFEMEQRSEVFEKNGGETTISAATEGLGDGSKSLQPSQPPPPQAKEMMEIFEECLDHTLHPTTAVFKAQIFEHYLPLLARYFSPQDYAMAFFRATACRLSVSEGTPYESFPPLPPVSAWDGTCHLLPEDARYERVEPIGVKEEKEKEEAAKAAKLEEDAKLAEQAKKIAAAKEEAKAAERKQNRKPRSFTQDGPEEKKAEPSTQAPAPVDPAAAAAAPAAAAPGAAAATAAQEQFNATVAAQFQQYQQQCQLATGQVWDPNYTAQAWTQYYQVALQSSYQAQALASAGARMYPYAS